MKGVKIEEQLLVLEEEAGRFLWRKLIDNRYHVVISAALVLIWGRVEPFGIGPI